MKVYDIASLKFQERKIPKIEEFKSSTLRNQELGRISENPRIQKIQGFLKHSGIIKDSLYIYKFEGSRI